MAKLVVSLPNGAVTHELNAPSVSVGRAAGNTIQIRDPSVSAYHGEFILRDGRYCLRDLDSTNKTWIDEEAVSFAVLHGACTIKFGAIIADFSDEAAAIAPPGESAKQIDAQQQLEALIAERDEACQTRARLDAEIENLHRQLALLRQTNESLVAERDAAYKSDFYLAAQLTQTRERLESLDVEHEELKRELAAGAAKFEGGRELSIFKAEHDALKNQPLTIGSTPTEGRHSCAPGAPESPRSVLAERQLNAVLAECPRLVTWLHGGVQKRAAQQAKVQAEANKIVPIDSGNSQARLAGARPQPVFAVR